MEQRTLFDDAGEPSHLARSSDPTTSHSAARSLTLTISERHIAIYRWLRSHGPATDDQIATAMVDAGTYPRHEQARRAIRTLREEHRMIVAAYDAAGTQIQMENTSGRHALAWRVATTEAQPLITTGGHQ